MPLMLGCTMTSWGVTYIVGFALVHLPFIHDTPSFSLVAPHCDVEHVLFYSGARFFTLGSAEINPVTALSRPLTVLCPARRRWRSGSTRSRAAAATALSLLYLARAPLRPDARPA